MKRLFPIFLLLMISMISCNMGNSGSTGKDVAVITLYLQPYNGFPQSQLQKLQSDVQHCLDTLIPELKFDVKLRNDINLPASCYYKPRNRYRADSIIRYQRTLDKNNYIMGVMSQDISTTVHNVGDWGVLGLSFRPGKSAVVSNYRVKNKSLFYKVLVHEFLHNLGLPHCSHDDRSCYICDANKHPQLECQTRLCEHCKKELLMKMKRK